MKFILVFLLLQLCLSNSVISQSIKYDGMYTLKGENPDDCTDYLRFYADGFVLHVCSAGNLEKVASWLNYANEGGHESGFFYEEDGKVYISICNGKMRLVPHMFIGKANDNGELLILRHSYPMNGRVNKKIEEFRFEPFK